MKLFNQFSKQVERKITKAIIARHKEFSTLSILDKENLVIEVRNKIEDAYLFSYLFFITSSALFLLRFFIV